MFSNSTLSYEDKDRETLIVLYNSEIIIGLKRKISVMV